MPDGPKDPAVVALGESLIDLIGEVDASGEVAYRARPGGSPMNVAVAAARLGTPTAFVTRLSNDAFGAQLAAHVGASGVDLRWAERGPEPTSLAVVALDADGNARYAFYRQGTADVAYDPRPRPSLPSSVAVGCVTLSLLLEPARGAFRDLVAISGRAAASGGAATSDGAATSGPIVWIADPNVRPALMPDRDAFVREVDAWASLVDVVKVSDEDLEHLGLGEAEAAERWFARGARAVAVTAGGDGARLHRRGRPVLAVPGRDVAVVDTVGAGDTFTAGLATGLAAAGAPLDLERVDDAAWRVVLERAVAASSITCTRAGADPPTADELRAVL